MTPPAHSSPSLASKRHIWRQLCGFIASDRKLFQFFQTSCGTNLSQLSAARPPAPSSPRVPRGPDFGETLLLGGALALAVRPLHGPARGEQSTKNSRFVSFGGRAGFFLVRSMFLAMGYVQGGAGGWHGCAAVRSEAPR